LGFTHVELLPIMEHPLDDSWGYQTTGYFAPSQRFGSPDDFRYFVDLLHQRGIGVILDWVPAHFPRDAHALACFDGTALYEHADPRRGEHTDWGTLIFNYGRNEVKNFLLASANYWLEEFHLDGLRVDAVASMLYLDYSREEGEWEPNRYGGRENLEAIDFLRELNTLTHGRHPGTLTIAEESTAWPQVTRPTWVGGLGFSMKWNMGWMHDTLSYLSQEPIYRQYHHDQLTFGLVYAFSENFMLPFSHDEVVHGKYSMLGKMPGDEWQRFANLRLLYTYMFTYPGAKLLFMGCELGEPGEWRHQGQLSWDLLDKPLHSGLKHLVGDLNHLYRSETSLHRNDFTPAGFEWIDCHDATQSVLSYIRWDGEDFHIVVLNFTPVVRRNYRIGVPRSGVYREAFNSDSRFYGGSDVGNGPGIQSEPVFWMGHGSSLSLTLPPLAALVLTLTGEG
jgi:1,4-alpha-glucan branching enzyme